MNISFHADGSVTVMPFCSRCGREIPSGMKFCMHCGTSMTAPLPTPPTTPPQPPKPSHATRNIIAVVMLVLLIGAFAAALSVPRPETTTPQTTTPQMTGTSTPSPKTETPLDQRIKIVMLDYKVSFYGVSVDAVHLDNIILKLRNEGGISVETDELIISSNKESVRDHGFATLEPGKEKEVSFKFITAKLSKEIGVEQIEVTMKLLGYESKSLHRTEQTLLEKRASIQIPKAQIGDTISEVRNHQNLSLTFLWWKESNIAVREWSENYYYTFTAKPGMKFVILAYRFQNDGIRAQSTPYFSSGEVATNKGYIYSIWTAPGGLSSKEHKPRTATTDEIRNLMGKLGAFKQLLPGESTEGCVAFEIPADTTPIEASLVYVPLLIRYR